MNEINQSLLPIVSVVIPVRNCRDYIDESVASVLSQSYRNFELLVIDDGSDDDDYTRLLELDPRVRVARLAGNGVSKARNVGMAMARGKYVAFLDADDVWFPGKLPDSPRLGPLPHLISCVRTSCCIRARLPIIDPAYPSPARPRAIRTERVQAPLYRV